MDENNARMKEFAEIKKKALLIAVVAIIVLFGSTLSSSFYTVPTGEKAIVFRFGKIVAVKEAGLQFKAPLITSVERINVKNEKVVTKHNLSTSDMQTFNLEVATEIKVIDPEAMYKSFGKNIVEVKIRPLLENVVQENVTRYTLAEFTKNRPQLDRDIYTRLIKEMEGTGVAVVSFKTGNHDFSDEFEAAINSKKVAEQIAERHQIEYNQKLQNAKKEFEIKQQIAKANEVETNSLTPAILQKMWIEKWDGKLPTVVSDKSMIQVPTK